MSKFGFIAIDVVGDNGSFMYPDDRYKSTVVELNTRTLHTVPRLERQRMLHLRSNPECTVSENDVTLKYFLKLDRSPVKYFKNKNYRGLLRKASGYIALGRNVTRPALQGVKILLANRNIPSN
jgi:hypothetical protein